jgi:Na+/H+ antiporter NhaD/arsenite permease-like protein
MKIDRPGMAIIGAFLMVAFRIVPASEALRFIDFGTLVLLFSMMLVVGCLRLTGFFEWVAEQIITRLKPRHLLPTIIGITGVLSAFFVNDIICLVMVPFALAATRRMGLKPLPDLSVAPWARGNHWAGAGLADYSPNVRQRLCARRSGTGGGCDVARPY